MIILNICMIMSVNLPTGHFNNAQKTSDQNFQTNYMHCHCTNRAFCTKLSHLNLQTQDDVIWQCTAIHVIGHIKVCAHSHKYIVRQYMKYCWYVSTYNKDPYYIRKWAETSKESQNQYKHEHYIKTVNNCSNS